MIDIAQPRLNDGEWRDVRATLSAIADCGCGEASPKPQKPGRLSALISALAGPPRATAALSAREDAVRRFVCETGRFRHIAEAHVPHLIAHGFSRAQIDAIAMLA